jgi:hypothetical protein
VLGSSETAKRPSSRAHSSSTANVLTATSKSSSGSDDSKAKTASHEVIHQRQSAGATPASQYLGNRRMLSNYFNSRVDNFIFFSFRMRTCPPC